eukprot:1988988-Alexandrium_andersonii.AAC.1
MDRAKELYEQALAMKYRIYGYGASNADVDETRRCLGVVSKAQALKKFRVRSACVLGGLLLVSVVVRQLFRGSQAKPRSEGIKCTKQ